MVRLSTDQGFTLKVQGEEMNSGFIDDFNILPYSNEFASAHEILTNESIPDSQEGNSNLPQGSMAELNFALVYSDKSFAGPSEYCISNSASISGQAQHMDQYCGNAHSFNQLDPLGLTERFKELEGSRNLTHVSSDDFTERDRYHEGPVNQALGQ